MSVMDKVMIPLVMVVLKTKRIAKSAVNGRINYQAKQLLPYAVGVMIASWTWFIYLA